jgi:hypothetical protein
MGIILPWHVTPIGEGRNAYRILVGKPEGKRGLETLKNRLGGCGLN